MPWQTQGFFYAHRPVFLRLGHPLYSCPRPGCPWGSCAQRWCPHPLRQPSPRPAGAGSHRSGLRWPPRPGSRPPNRRKSAGPRVCSTGGRQLWLIVAGLSQDFEPCTTSPQEGQAPAGPRPAARAAVGTSGWPTIPKPPYPPNPSPQLLLPRLHPGLSIVRCGLKDRGHARRAGWVGAAGAALGLIGAGP